MSDILYSETTVNQYAEISDYLCNEIQDDLYSVIREETDDKSTIIQDNVYNDITDSTLNEISADQCNVMSADLFNVIPSTLHYESTRRDQVNTNFLQSQPVLFDKVLENSSCDYFISNEDDQVNVYKPSAITENLQAFKTIITDKIEKTKELCSLGERYIHNISKCLR